MHNLLKESVCVCVRACHGWRTGTRGAGFHHRPWDNIVLVSPLNLSASYSTFFCLFSPPPPFFCYTHFFYIPLFLSLYLSYACTHSLKPLKLADTKADRSITDLSRIYLNFSWPHIDLYITQIFLHSKARLRQRVVVSDRGMDERAVDLKRDEKGESIRMKLREWSMGRFWQRFWQGVAGRGRGTRGV